MMAVFRRHGMTLAPPPACQVAGKPALCESLHSGNEHT
jgi:hypothetical protein